MRAIYALLLFVGISCTSSTAKPEATSPDKAKGAVGATESASKRYCTKYDICFDDVNRADYASDEELMCDAYCTYYCACYEKIEGKDCYEGTGCSLACESGLAKEDERDDWLRRIVCSQEAKCKRFMDEC